MQLQILSILQDASKKVSAGMLLNVVKMWNTWQIFREVWGTTGMKSTKASLASPLRGSVFFRILYSCRFLQTCRKNCFDKAAIHQITRETTRKITRETTRKITWMGN